eukprot:TRINITY_DN12448_c0_g1_i1.p1 TRINITY_DN12448_c0_g1~~TRINITY_DN12448_c0_g1_i1.p1  ORF type:complete len:351 (-),score=40.75 TRINITY_DN12448_c0_g1_i1:13-1065(-)
MIFIVIILLTSLIPLDFFLDNNVNCREAFHQEKINSNKLPDSLAPPKLLKGHKDGLRCIHFKNNILVSGARETSLRFWNLVSNDNEEWFDVSDDTIQSVQLAPDFVIVGTGPKSSLVKTYDLNTKQSTAVIKGHDEWVSRVQYDARSEVIVSASHDKTIKLWDRRTNQLIRTLEGHSCGVWSLQLDQDFIWSGAGFPDCSARVWDRRTMSTMLTCNGNRGGVFDLHYSDGQLFGGSTGKLVFWKVNTNEDCGNLRAADFIAAPDEFIMGVQFDKKKLVTAGYDNKVAIYDLASVYSSFKAKSDDNIQPNLEYTSHTEPIRCMQYNNKWLITGSLDHNISVWDLTKQNEST